MYDPKKRKEKKSKEETATQLKVQSCIKIDPIKVWLCGPYCGLGTPKNRKE